MTTAVCVFNEFCWETIIIQKDLVVTINSLYISVGACLPLLVTLLAWRLALLIPPRKLGIEEAKLARGDDNYFLKETNSMLFSTGTVHVYIYNMVFRMAQYNNYNYCGV